MGTFEDIIKDLKHSFRNKQKKESFIKKLSIKITGFLKKIPGIEHWEIEPNLNVIFEACYFLQACP